MSDFEIRYTATEADIDRIHHYLSTQSYWAANIPRPLVARSFENSLPFLVFDGDTLAAFARVVTDKATFAHLADVFVVVEYRGGGVGKRLMEAVMAHPDLQDLRRFLLFTRDAHGLYARYGFTGLERPGRAMQRLAPRPYPAPDAVEAVE